MPGISERQAVRVQGPYVLQHPLVALLVTCLTPEEECSLAKEFRSNESWLEVCPEFLCPDIGWKWLRSPSLTVVCTLQLALPSASVLLLLPVLLPWWSLWMGALHHRRLLGLWTCATCSGTWAGDVSPAEQWGAHGKSISLAAMTLFQRDVEPASQFLFSPCS